MGLIRKTNYNDWTYLTVVSNDLFSPSLALKCSFFSSIYIHFWKLIFLVVNFYGLNIKEKLKLNLVSPIGLKFCKGVVFRNQKGPILSGCP